MVRDVLPSGKKMLVWWIIDVFTNIQIWLKYGTKRIDNSMNF